MQEGGEWRAVAAQKMLGVVLWDMVCVMLSSLLNLNLPSIYISAPNRRLEVCRRPPIETKASIYTLVVGLQGGMHACERENAENHRRAFLVWGSGSFPLAQSRSELNFSDVPPRHKSNFLPPEREAPKSSH